MPDERVGRRPPGRVEMPKQDPAERRRNFEEVALGLTAEQAAAEAARCLQCKDRPCVSGCPVGVPIPEFIRALREGDVAAAARLIKEKNNLPAICGRVCPQETQCEERCLWAKRGQPIAIGALERYVADWEAEAAGEGDRPGPGPEAAGERSSGGADPEPDSRHRARRETSAAAEPGLAGLAGDSPDLGAGAPAAGRGERPAVAVVGSGPAGLAAAADLARAGYRVTIFESLHAPGGVLRYGIPEFRLPKRILDREIRYVQSLGVRIETNVLVGRTVTLEELFQEGFEAVFIATGAGLPHFLGIPGEHLNGVYSANEFLTRINLMRAYLFPEYDTPIRVGRQVAVIGGGNVAMDAARTALRLGAEEVDVVYRRSRAEMPARREEIENAEEEGIQFHLLANPVEILGDEKGWVRGLVLQRMELGEPDERGRRRPVPVPGSEWTLEVETVVVAIGQGPNPLLVQSTPGLAATPQGQIIVQSGSAQTSLPGVFAGGDIVTGAATVILAMGAGKAAAAEIDRYLRAKKEASAGAG
ncbi:MAG: FAD-dependent oxidoreductase [Bacillota bacterium]|nr:FAD-dependent oxidoreductase [Bacillota bacterium]